MAFQSSKYRIKKWVWRAVLCFLLVFTIFHLNPFPSSEIPFESSPSSPSPPSPPSPSAALDENQWKVQNPILKIATPKNLHIPIYYPTCPPHPSIDSVKIPYGYIPAGLRKEGRVICDGKSKVTIYPGQIIDIQNALLDFNHRKFVGGYSVYMDGFLTVDCTFTDGNWHRNLITGKIKEDHVSPLDQDTLVIEGPTITISRDDCGNTWHSLADFMKPFTGLAVLGESTLNARVLVLDERLMVTSDPDDVTVCPYHGALDAIGRQGVLRGSSYQGKKVFFNRLAITDDYTGTLNQIWSMSFCDTSESLGKYVDNLFDYFGMGTLSDILMERYQKNNEPQTQIKITVSSRRKKPFAPSNAKIGRVITNEEEMIKRLKEIPHVHVETVEFFELEFKDQLILMRNTDILVGMHGAGLTNLIYTPLDAHVLELIPFTWESNEYFSLSRITGRTYHKWRNQDKLKHQEDGCKELAGKKSVDGPNVCRTGTSKTTVDVEAIAKIVEEAANSLRISRFT